MRIELMKRMSQRLNLVPDQRQKIEAIVTTGQQRMRQLWEPVAPQAHELLRELRKNIEAELTPAQRQTFSQLMKERPARPPGERPEWRRREGRAEEGRGPEAPSPR
jgi:Spy/CpxP family protein refolding chaperone